MKYPIIGIDLGTCFTCVYGFRNDQYVNIPGERGNTIPSVVQYNRNGVICGRTAKESIRKNSANTIYDVKRFLGLSYQECEGIIQMEKYGFSCIPYGQSLVYEISYDNTTLFKTPEMVDADFLRYLVERASQYLECEIVGAVITVPAFFQYTQIAATLEAARQANLHVFRIIYEPSAAAIASNVALGAESKTILVYDLGGGTFDVAVIKAALYNYQVIGNNGHPFLGGRDFDAAIFDIMKEQLASYGIDVLTWDRNRLAGLRSYAEEVKIELSRSNAYEVDLTEYVGDVLVDGDDAQFYITRKKFEKRIRGRIEETIAICKSTLQSLHITLGSSDSILLVGGSSRIPLVREMLKEAFGDIIVANNNPNEDVAKGACMTALDDYCKSLVPPIQNPCPPPTIHTFVVRPVAVRFGNGPYISVLPAGTLCDTKIEKVGGHFVLGTTVHVYSKEIPRPGIADEWKRVASFSVNGFHGQAYIRMSMDRMGILHYEIGRVGHEPDCRDSVKIGERDPKVIQLFDRRLVNIQNGVALLKNDRQCVEQSNTRVKEQLLQYLDRALAYLGKEDALRVPEEQITEYVQKNHTLTLPYINAYHSHVC